VQPLQAKEQTRRAQVRRRYYCLLSLQLNFVCRRFVMFSGMSPTLTNAKNEDLL
jgi:hypothetical protein